MKAYISDPEDLKQDLSYQDTWDDMIINNLWMLVEMLSGLFHWEMLLQGSMIFML